MTSAVQDRLNRSYRLKALLSRSILHTSDSITLAFDGGHLRQQAVMSFHGDGYHLDGPSDDLQAIAGPDQSVSGLAVEAHAAHAPALSARYEGPYRGWQHRRTVSSSRTHQSRLGSSSPRKGCVCQCCGRSAASFALQSLPRALCRFQRVLKAQKCV